MEDSCAPYPCKDMSTLPCQPKKGEKGKAKMKSLRLVLIRYYDHVEFRNYDCRQLNPMLREVVGWLIHEDSDHIVVLSEKAVSNNPEEIAKLKPSGFVILKSTIKEVVELC